MSDVSGAPDVGAGAAPLALPTFAEAASERLSDLKRDGEFAGKYLGGSADARNQMKTLLTIAHGGVDEATAATLAESVKLVRIPSAAAAERQRQAAETAAAAGKVNIPFELASKLGPEETTTLANDAGAWLNSLQLPASIRQTVSGRISEMGPRVGRMSAEEQRAWVSEQDKMLAGAAGSPERAAQWRASAEKVLAGSKYAGALITRDAFIVRHLALAADAKKTK
jgi:hypothetical protein